MIACDLDNLKTVNDEQGHLVGDTFIREAADILRYTFRLEDVVARIGGDEFAIILPFVNEDQLASILKRLKTNIEYRNNSFAGDFSMSIGAAIAHRGDALLHTLKDADAAMYIAKKQKKLQAITYTV